MTTIPRHPSIVDPSTLTKQSETTRSIEVYEQGLDNENYKNEIITLLNKMIDEGKTDGGQWETGGTEPDQIVVHRRWIDQSAAEEWIAITQPVITSYQLPIISYEIVDY
jgi:hypothetical protein